LTSQVTPIMPDREQTNAKPTYAANALNNMGVVRFTGAQSLDITSSNDFATVIAF
jgi:hypothetical protein